MTQNLQHESKRMWLTGSLILLLVCGPRVFAETVITLGPYDGEESLAKITTFLDANNIPFDSNRDAVKESLGFIVVTSQISPGEASTTIDELQGQQVKDLLYIRSGVYSNQLSAGVFGTEDSANRRAANLSRYGFSVLERTRTLYSASITVFRADISPAFEEIFEAFTGVQIPPDEANQPVDLIKPIPRQDEPAAVMEPPGESVISEGEGTKKEIHEIVKKIPGKQLSKKESFPFIPFLMIATSIVIVFGLGYYFLIRRSPQPARVQLNSQAPPQTPLYQEVITQAQRQLDSSVAAISAYANQLLAGKTPAAEEVPQYIATICSGGIEVLDLISDIIDLSRIEIGQVEIERISFDPESALQDLVKSFSLKAEQKGISLHFESDESLPNLIASDPTKLEKILSILVSYSIENTESGRVLITATFLSQLDSLKITIAHTSESFISEKISGMFEPIGSTSGISTEQRLRFAVSKRLANLMGGDVQVISQSDHDIEYVVTVQADEILKKQLLLPSGVSIDELVQSEGEAKELADHAQLALVAAQTETHRATQAQTEAESRLALEVEAKSNAEARAETDARARIEAESLITMLSHDKESIEKEIEKRQAALTEATSRAESLSVELETVRNAASNEMQRRAQQEKKTHDKILQLASELTTVKNQLQSEIASRSEKETSVHDTVAELQEALERATISIQDEARAKEQSEQQAREQIEHISMQLAEADAAREEFSERLQTHEATKNQVDELRSALSDAKARLQEEIDLHSNAELESESKVETLLTQLNRARSDSEQESSARVELEVKLVQLNEELEENRRVLEAQLADSQQLSSDSQLQADKLAAELEQTHSAADHRISELEKLQGQLSISESSLTNDLTVQQQAANKFQQEVESLKSALALAEEKLTKETEFRNRVEQSSGRQIDSLIDDVNKAKATARQEAETRAGIEKENQRKIDLVSTELSEARSALDVDATTRAELERVNMSARETSQLLSEAESRIKQIELEKEEAGKQVAANKNALDKLRVELARNAKAEQATRKGPEQPVEPVHVVTSRPASIPTEPASTESISADSSSSDFMAEEESSPIYSSRDMSNPILRSMVERFIVRLSQHLDAMDTVFQQQDYLGLVIIVNWIKSEAFNLGFSEFEPIVSALELCLRQKEFDSISDMIGQLRQLDLHIELQDVPVDDGSSLGVKPQSIEVIKIPLPVGEKKTELLENFISQLGSKLLEMQSAWNEGNVQNLEQVCKWILRYGGRLHLPVVISATEELQSAIRHADADRISQKLWNFIGLYSNIELERKL